MRSSFVAAGYAVLSVVVLAALCHLSATFPLLLLALPAYFIASYIPAERWERLAMVPLLSVILASSFVTAFALYDAYSLRRGYCVVGLLNVVALAGLFWRRKEKEPLQRLQELIPTRHKVLIGLLCVSVAIPFVYGMVFNAPGFNNDLVPGYAQMGLNIMRTGSFHLLWPSQSCYDNSTFFYMPAFPGAIAWISSCLPFSRLDGALGFLAPSMIACFILLTLAISYRIKLRFTSALLGLFILLPSYALFKISYEIESDNLGLACAALFVYLLIRLTEEGRNEKSLWFFTGVLWSFGWWIRPYLGIYFTMVLVALFAFSPAARKSIGESVGSELTVVWRPLGIGFVVFSLLWGLWWNILLWVHTGTPIAPRSISLFGFELAKMKPAFEYWNVLFAPAASSPSGGQAENPYLYHFFPIVFSEGWKLNLMKSLRGLLHGNTFSGLFSIGLLAGLFLAAKKMWLKRRLFSAEGILVTFAGSVFLFATVMGAYFKFFLAAVPVFVSLLVLFLDSLVDRADGKKDKLQFAAGLFLAMVFIFSFMWSGVGAWPTNRRWSVFKGDWRDPQQREWIKNGDSLAPALTYLRGLDPKEKFLAFHPEPGMALPYELDHHPYWEDYHYDSQLLAGLHRLDSKKKVMLALKSLGIRHLIFTYSLDKYKSGLAPEILPKMIENSAPELKLVASSSGHIYRIYRLIFS